MEIDLSRFRDTFFQEADEHLRDMESGLLSLEENPDPEQINAVFRGAHSIKGASGTFGFEAVMRFTHAMESLLDDMRADRVAVSRSRVDLLLTAVDVLRRLVDAARTGAQAPEETERVTQLMRVAQRAGEFSPDHPAAVRAADVPASWSIRFRPSPDVLRQGMDPVLVLRNLSRLGDIRSIEPELSGIPGLVEMTPDTCYLGWTVRLQTEASAIDIQDIFAFVEDGARLEIRQESRRDRRAPASEAPRPRAASPGDSGTIRVATGKVDKLIDLVGELVIAQSMATQILAGCESTQLVRLQEAFAEVERYTRELQERLMGIRMLPIGNVFSRLPRLVRDLAGTTGKQLSLEIRGEDTELDKSVVERLGDALMHLVRNAADHGIEPPEERIAAGKPAVGTIGLSAYHQGGSVIVDISDDGRGLDRDAILAKARERGIVSGDEDLSDDRVYALIFEAGFSTAATVTDISGRGVGMDVVKKSVDGLNGTIAILSEPGRGVVFRVKLPLTLAILDGLLLRVGSQRYVLPLISIMESIAPRREELSNIAGRGEVISLRGEPLPVVRLRRLFDVVDDGEADPGAGLAVIVEHHGKRLALLVDELLGQQQVVIKSLETHFRKVEGAMGATILGDGQPALILDVTAIAEMAKGGAERRAAA